MKLLIFNHLEKSLFSTLALWMQGVNLLQLDAAIFLWKLTWFLLSPLSLNCFSHKWICFNISSSKAYKLSKFRYLIIKVNEPHEKKMKFLTERKSHFYWNSESPFYTPSAYLNSYISPEKIKHNKTSKTCSFFKVMWHIEFRIITLVKGESRMNLTLPRISNLIVIDIWDIFYFYCLHRQS